MDNIFKVAFALLLNTVIWFHLFHFDTNRQLKQFYFKQFSLALVHFFLFTELNDLTVLSPTNQFFMSTKLNCTKYCSVSQKFN